MFYISGLYKFKKITHINKKKIILKKLFIKNNIKGLLIISKEGINGTLAAKKKNLDLGMKKIRKIFIVKVYQKINFNLFEEQKLK